MSVAMLQLGVMRFIAKNLVLAILQAIPLALLLLMPAPALSDDGDSKPVPDPDTMLADEVVVELPEADSPDSHSAAYYGNVPLIVVLPFTADAPDDETASALAYGIAAGIVDNVYPLAAVRTIPLDRLIRFAGRDAIGAALAGGDAVSELAENLGAGYVVTGNAVVKDGGIEIVTKVFDSAGDNVKETSLSGALETLPALLPRLSFDVLTTCGIALTDDERQYLDYAEPYGYDVWVKCHYGLSVVTQRLAGIVVSRSDVDAARKSLAAAIKAAPDYLRAREALGVLEMLSGDADAAEIAFRELAARYPGHAPARYYLGVILYDKGNYADAKLSLTLAAELNKRDPLAWYYLGRTHLAVDQPAMAEQALEKSLTLDPSNPDTYFALGLALIALENYADAQTAFAEVVMRKPAMPEAHFNFAICLIKNGDRALAAKHLRHYIELTPGDPAGDHAQVEKVIAELTKSAVSEPDVGGAGSAPTESVDGSTESGDDSADTDGDESGAGGGSTDSDGGGKSR
jgi:tetratricopeptide (TPR) repeat protein